MTMITPSYLGETIEYSSLHACRSTLEDPTAAEVEDHVDECPSCRARLEPLAWECPTPMSPSPFPLPEAGEYPEIPGFEIQRELGRGSTGVVYLARHQALGRQVALKVIPAIQGADQEARERWGKEAKAFSLVRHPNVVVLYDVGAVGSWYYLVLEYIPGATLKIRLCGPMAPRDSAQLMVTIAKAVHAIHQAGLLHLDLKPSNILMDGETECSLDITKPKVADFGIARFLVDGEHADRLGMTAYGPWSGTPPYMAPEQISGTRDQLCPATDVHALGAILFHLVTGRPPSEGVLTPDAVNSPCTGERLVPRPLTPRLSRDLQTIILKCLNKDSGRRYATALSLAEDLSRWLDGRPIHARPVPLVEHFWRFCRRQPVIASLAVLLAVTTVVAFGVLFGPDRRAEAQRAHAETARAAAEENLKVATTLMTELHDSALNRSYGPEQNLGRELVATAGLIREQISKIRSPHGFSPELLPSLGRIEFALAARLRSLGRFDEARSMISEWIDLLRECRQRKPADANYDFELVDALGYAGGIEDEAGRVDEALDLLAQASSLVLSLPISDPQWNRLGMLLTEHYHRFGERLAQEGDLARSKRAIAGYRKLISLIDRLDSDRPDVLLFRACALADQGEWGRAQELVQMLSRGGLSIKAVSPTMQLSLRERLEKWFEREIRNWESLHERRATADPAQDRVVAEIFSRMSDLHKALKMEWPTPPGFKPDMGDALSGRAAFHRKAGRLDKADRTVAFFIAIARRLVDEFPDHAGPYHILSDAYSQQSKNAWKRNDLAAVKQALTNSVEAVHRATVLLRNNAELLRVLEDRKGRLAGLPKL